VHLEKTNGRPGPSTRCTVANARRGCRCRTNRSCRPPRRTPCRAARPSSPRRRGGTELRAAYAPRWLRPCRGRPGTHRRRLPPSRGVPVHSFFAELGTERAGRIEAVSMDMGPACAASVRAHAPRATVCIDPFHAVKVVTDAPERSVPRGVERAAPHRQPQGCPQVQGRPLGAAQRTPTNLSDEQAATLRKLKRRGGDVWRAYTLKEAFRGDLRRRPGHRRSRRADRPVDLPRQPIPPTRIPQGRAHHPQTPRRDPRRDPPRRQQRPRRRPQQHRPPGRAHPPCRGFHRAQAALALVMLSCGPITLQLPHERSP
jgi:transposase